MEGQARLAVEQLELAQRQDEVDDVTRLDAMRRVDDRDDVLARRADMELLLVAEELDDVGARPERTAAAAALADVEVLRPEPGDQGLARLGVAASR